MLDLNKLTSAKYEIKDLDGDILQFPKATQGFLNKIIGLQELEDENVINLAEELFLELLNSNKNGKVFTAEHTSRFDIGTMLYVLKDYLEFTVESLGE